MTQRLANRSPTRKVVPLNSGRTIILAPAEISAPIPEAEIAGSDRIAKLMRRGGLFIVSCDGSSFSDEVGDNV